MASISPLGGVGLGLLISFYLEKNSALLIGFFVLLIAAILLSIVSYLRNKNVAKQHN